MRNRFRALAALALGGALFLGAVLPTAAASKAMVRAAHLIPDAPAVDVLVNGDVVLEDVPFKAVSDYLMVNAGAYRGMLHVPDAAQAFVTLAQTQAEMTAACRPAHREMLKLRLEAIEAQIRDL